MPKEEWGVKRVCPTTGKRFYDLNRSPIISPYTGEEVVIETPGRKIGTDATSDKVKPATAAPAAGDDNLIDDDDVAVDDDDLLDDDEDDSTVSLDDLADVAGEDDEG